MKLEICKRCDGTDLVWVENLECEDTMTNELVMRNGVLCKDCECFHYFKDDIFCYEFYVRPVVYEDGIKLSEVTDYAVKKIKKDDITKN